MNFEISWNSAVYQLGQNKSSYMCYLPFLLLFNFLFIFWDPSFWETSKRCLVGGFHSNISTRWTLLRGGHRTQVRARAAGDRCRYHGGRHSPMLWQFWCEKMRFWRDRMRHQPFFGPGETLIGVHPKIGMFRGSRHDFPWKLSSQSNVWGKTSGPYQWPVGVWVQQCNVPHKCAGDDACNGLYIPASTKGLTRADRWTSGIANTANTIEWVGTTSLFVVPAGLHRWL